MTPTKLFSPLVSSHQVALIFFILIITGCTALPSKTITGHNPLFIEHMAIATWKNNATAAYALVHDDSCQISTGALAHAWPELNQRSLIGSFGVNPSFCTKAEWQQHRALLQDGHEIFNHSWGHANAAEPPYNHQQEIGQADRALAKNLNGYRASFFGWPFDASNPDAMAYLKSLDHYVGARASNYVDTDGINPADFNNPFHIRFSVYRNDAPNLTEHVDAAIEQGGFALHEFHGVADTSWNAISLPAYQNHLNYLESKVNNNELWVAGPSDIIRYRNAREYCTLKLQSPTQKQQHKQQQISIVGRHCDLTQTQLTLVLQTSKDFDAFAGSEQLSVAKTLNGAQRITLPKGVAEITLAF